MDTQNKTIHYKILQKTPTPTESVSISVSTRKKYKDIIFKKGTKQFDW